MVRLIINADDFGLTAGVNRGIIDSFERGAVTSTTLLANGNAFSDAVRQALDHPELSVGVHLNFTDGTPVMAPETIPSLVDSRGWFLPKNVLIGRHVMGGVRLEDVRQEARAQIEKVLSCGLNATHIDGHKHLHIYPPFLEVIAELAVKYDIPRIRFPLERCPSLYWVTNGMPMYKWCRQFANMGLLAVTSIVSMGSYRKRHVSRTDYVLGILHTGEWNKAWLLRVLASLRSGCFELICHPGYCDSELLAEPTRLTTSRERELRILADSQVRAALLELGIELISFREL